MTAAARCGPGDIGGAERHPSAGAGTRTAEADDVYRMQVRQGRQRDQQAGIDQAVG
jgi:hypothetical protein